MPTGKVLKWIGRVLFWVFLGFVIVLYFYNRTAALVLLVVTIVGFVVSYLPVFGRGGRHVLGFLKDYAFIDGSAVAKRMGKPLYKIERALYKLAHEEKSDYVVFFAQNEYFFVHADVVDQFVTLYAQGYGERELLAEMKKYGIDTRDVVKAITARLEEQDRLPERKVSVKERRAQLKFS